MAEETPSDAASATPVGDEKQDIANRFQFLSRLPNGRTWLCDKLRSFRLNEQGKMTGKLEKSLTVVMLPQGINRFLIELYEARIPLPDSLYVNNIPVEEYARRGKTAYDGVEGEWMAGLDTVEMSVKDYKAVCRKMGIPLDFKTEAHVPPVESEETFLGRTGGSNKRGRRGRR